LTAGGTEENPISLSDDEAEAETETTSPQGRTNGNATSANASGAREGGELSAFVRNEEEEMPQNGYVASEVDEESEGEQDDDEDAEEGPTKSGTISAHDPDAPATDGQTYTADRLRQFDNIERRILERNVQLLYDGELVNNGERLIEQ
jgi:hypothetical protein